MTSNRERNSLANRGHKSAHPRQPKRSRRHERLLQESLDRGFHKMAILWRRGAL